MFVRRAIAALGLALCLGLGSSCVTPTIPIPPPEPEKMSFMVDPDVGTASFRFDPVATYSDAIVYVYNRDRGTGIITTANPDGSVDPTDPFAGEVGDDIIVTFEVDAQLGTTCVELADGRSSTANECVP